MKRVNPVTVASFPYGKESNSVAADLELNPRAEVRMNRLIRTGLKNYATLKADGAVHCNIGGDRHSGSIWDRRQHP